MSETERRPGAVALVLAAGSLPLPRLLPPLLEGVSLTVAADGGLSHARALGVRPDLLVGDFDSVTAEMLSQFSELEQERHPRDKDQLDLELAIDAALKRGAHEIRALGVFGGRLDQSIAALHIAVRYAAQGLTLSLHGASHEAHVLTGGQKVRLILPEGTTVSLIPLTETSSVSTEGLRYPLTRQAVIYGTGLGVSNSVSEGSGGAVELAVHEGTVALMVEHGLSTLSPQDAIWGAQAPRIMAALSSADPDLARLITTVAYDDVFARPGLDLRVRELLAVALLTANGSAADLRTHLRGALAVGASEVELRETIIHAAMFVGFPKALTAMRELASFLEARRASGDQHQ